MVVNNLVHNAGHIFLHADHLIPDEESNSRHNDGNYNKSHRIHKKLPVIKRYGHPAWKMPKTSCYIFLYYTHHRGHWKDRSPDTDTNRHGQIIFPTSATGEVQPWPPVPA